MENLSLFDYLVGYFQSENDDPVNIDRTVFDRLTEEEKLRKSIIENLKLVLQSKQGSVLHLPDFGLPDILRLYFESGNSLEPVKKQIQDTILKYEPRITHVKVQKSEFDPNTMRISLKIMATISNLPGKEFLLTEFSNTGWTKVVFERDIT